jgi:hypothetical protein
MYGSGTEADKAAKADVLDAFLTARNAGRPQVDCYLAGPSSWRGSSVATKVSISRGSKVKANVMNAHGSTPL